MMPHNFAQWFWLLYFGGGALGGWMVVVLFAIDVARGWKRAKWQVNLEPKK